MFGVPNPWVILGGVVIVVSLTAGAYFYGNHVGSVTTTVAWQAREAKAASRSAEVLQAAQDRAIAAERDNAKKLAEASASYQEKLKEKDREKAAAVASTRRLFVGTVGPQGCGNPLPSTGAGAPGRDGETRSELSKPAAEFLIGEASRADKIVEQLTACQAIVAEDRK
jgi:prophage endopeptidase